LEDFGGKERFFKRRKKGYVSFDTALSLDEMRRG